MILFITPGPGPIPYDPFSHVNHIALQWAKL